MSRYHVDGSAKLHRDSGAPHASDRAVRDQDELFDGFRVLDVKRADEIALWLPRQAALVFGDAMLRSSGGVASVETATS